MRINHDLIQAGLLHWPLEENVISILMNLLQRKDRISLPKEKVWEDTTEVILYYLGARHRSV